MLYSKALIVNHAVMQTPTNSGFGSVDKIVNYMARLERHLGRGGLDQTITDDDQRLARIQDMVDYRTRSGRHEGRGQDMPMAKGEVSGGCFDIRGVRDVSSLAQEIEQSGSNLVTSFISVKRENAEQLGLTTKQDFQRLYRNTWERHFSKLGVIKPHDLKSVAFFHTDNPTNLHIHVLSWDESGRFSGDALIPKSNLLPARQVIYQEVFKPDLKELYVAKEYLRELTLAQIKTELGQTVGLGTLMKLNELRTAVSFPQYRDVSLRSADNNIDSSTRRKLRESVIGERTKGYVQYGSLTKEGRALIDDFQRDLFKGSHNLSNLDALYKQLLQRLAELNGYKLACVKEYIGKQARDLDRRVGNAISRNIGVIDNTIPQNIVERNLRGTAAVASLSIKSPTSADIDKLSWAFTPEQKVEIEELYNTLTGSVKEKERGELVKALGNKIYALPSIQARVKQSSIELARIGNMNYQDAYKTVSQEYRAVISRVIERTGEKSILEKATFRDGGVQDVFIALMYSLPGKSQSAKAKLDSLQKCASWKRNRERYALGRKSIIKLRQ